MHGNGNYEVYEVVHELKLEAVTEKDNNNEKQRIILVREGFCSHFLRP